MVASGLAPAANSRRSAASDLVAGTAGFEAGGSASLAAGDASEEGTGAADFNPVSVGIVAAGSETGVRLLVSAS